MGPRRDWRDANAEKRGPCRVCENPSVELAHVTARAHDPLKPGTSTRYVRPASVVPLCQAHHALYDRHELNLLPYLQADEQVMAVEDLGLYAAYIRVCSISRAERLAA